MLNVSMSKHMIPAYLSCYSLTVEPVHEKTLLGVEISAPAVLLDETLCGTVHGAALKCSPFLSSLCMTQRHDTCISKLLPTLCRNNA
jgi:hypothetical protein